MALALRAMGGPRGAVGASPGPCQGAVGAVGAHRPPRACPDPAPHQRPSAAPRQTPRLQSKPESEGLLGTEAALQGCWVLIIWSVTKAAAARTMEGGADPRPGAAMAPQLCIGAAAFLGASDIPFHRGRCLGFYELFKTLSLEVFFFSLCLNLTK